MQSRQQNAGIGMRRPGLSLKPLTGACAVWLSCMLTFSAGAQTYPDRPIKIVVNSAAGGGLDTTTRMLAET